MKVYIVGPMRGRPHYNFPAFDATRDKLVKEGHTVLSPADMDRNFGFDAMTLDPKDPCLGIPKGFDLIACVRRDFEAVLWCDAIYALPGWQDSRGSRAEVAVAQWLGKPILNAADAAVAYVVGMFAQAEAK